MKKRLIVAGASGVVGSAITGRFSAMPDWEVIGLSRRGPPRHQNIRVDKVDLFDRDSCASWAAELTPMPTYFVYAAQYETPGMIDGWSDPGAIARNGQMLKNIFDPLNLRGEIQHATLITGTKAYGVHVPELIPLIRNPMRESDPRLEHPNFYFVQEDYLKALQAKADWGLTVFIPQAMLGDADGANMNGLRVMAVYAALEREKGDVLDYPGISFAQAFCEATDSDLLADAVAWAHESPKARNRTFNVTNGDTFRWRYEWDRIAEAFGMVRGERRPQSLAESLPKRNDEWARLVDKYNLDVPRSIEEHLGSNSLIFADWCLGQFNSDELPQTSTIALREAGFDNCIDTGKSILKWMARIQDQGIVSPRTRNAV